MAKEMLHTLKDPYIKSAYDQLQIISQDEQKRMEYEAREKAILDYNQGMYEAEQRGVSKTAKKLLALGVDINTIAEATSLSIDEINALNK